MKTYPYPTPDGITQLVEESEYNRLKWELEESKAKHAADVSELNARLTNQQADMLERIVQLRAELTSWQAMAERLATALDNLSHDCTNHSIDIQKIRWGHDGDAGAKLSAEQIEECCNAAKLDLAAYESAKKCNLPDPLAEAVKRMESVHELWRIYATHDSPAAYQCINAVRARLISAAKGEQP